MCCHMKMASEDALLEEDIWEYKSIRKRKRQSSSQSISAPGQEVSDGKGRPKKKRNRKKKSTEKTDTPQKTKQSSRPGQDVDSCTEDSRVQSQESVSSLAEQSSQNAKPVHDGFCPSCQMPFSLLLVQTPQWHVYECLETPGAIEKECPDGLLCTSTIPSHYKRYSHFLLAANRAGEYLVNPLGTTEEMKMTCSAAAKPSCSPSYAEETSQSEKPSTEIKHIANDDCAAMVRNSPQMKSLNIISGSTSFFAGVEKPQQALQLPQVTDNHCKFEFFDFASSQESKTGKDLCIEKGASQPSLLQSGVDFNDCEISYSPLSTFEESEDEEEEKVKVTQDKSFEVQNSEEDSNSVAFKTFDRPLLWGKPQYEHKKMENFLTKKTLCEEENALNHLDPQRGVVASGSSFSSSYRGAVHPELISSAARAGTSESEDAGACALDSAHVSFTEPSSLLDREDAASLLTQKSNVLREPSNILTCTDKMTSKSVPSLSSATVNTKSSPPKELKQMDIGVFFGLKPKAKEERKGAACLNEKKHIPASESPNGKRPRQQKRKAEGSVGDVEAVTETSSKNEAIADVPSGGQRRWRKKFKELPTTGEEPRKKHCPFYKKIPGTGFTVDAFQYGEIEGCTAYFLTHFHSDHYCGLTKNFRFPIYCNKVTGNLVKSKLRVQEQFVHVLPMDTQCVVNGIKVMLLDANHCPGATMILFYLPSGAVILHTGDFRADPSMERYPALMGQQVHTLYLDTTYCSPEYTFPAQQEVIQFAVNIAFETVTLNPRTLVVCGTYSIGKEKVFLAIAEVLGSKASVSREKYKTLQCLESAAVNSLISVDWKGTLLHVLPMMQINFKRLQDHLNKFSENFDQILAFKPTGWTYSDSCLSLEDIKPQTRGKITIYGIPYSEHSSYLEMKRFVQWLKPQKIIPTVNVGDWRDRSLMEMHFRDWMTESSRHK
ncbi:PREDICTED: DNA cross-link repair 1A protein [Ficedula albicollis]|uniref:DNA cross-link repair 1A protein n=1 Tax=Ficedula albicollis TaxID=59894 RepID=UPI0007AD85C6|nr:PREDICTED: DNA cross-link repair 1A protein [Ficedula albicollis]